MAWTSIENYCFDDFLYEDWKFDKIVVHVIETFPSFLSLSVILINDIWVNEKRKFNTVITLFILFTKLTDDGVWYDIKSDMQLSIDL